VREALRNIIRRKARSALTIFGVAIGIFAFTTMGALAQNINNSISNALDYYASRINVTSASGGGPNNFAVGGQLPANLGERIKVIDGVQAAYPTITLPADDSEAASFGPPSLIYAYRPQDLPADAKLLELQSGRRFNQGETGRVIIGSNVVKDKKLKLGDTVTVRGQLFEVVGILDRTGGAPDKFFIMNLDDAQQFIRQSNVFAAESANFVTNIEVIPKPGTDADALAGQINEKVRGVKAIPPNQFKKQIEQASQVFYLIILGSAVVAVLVGGLSVVNTMIMSVNERRREIGIKRVVGAKTRHVLKEHLTETVVMSGIGGLIGSGLGYVVTSVINARTSASGLEIFTFSPELAGAGIGFAVGLGLLAGIYPSWRASRIKPVEVLAEE
jgi:putative ABC transport system permease protein